jgi:HEAT repeat protein
LLGRIGPAALEAARALLQHPQWYVVRNAVKLLGEVRDPELLRDVTPALRHPDERVQKTAIKVLQDARVPGRAAAIASALPYMKPHTAEEMLNDLRYAKDASAVQGLGAFIFHDSRTSPKLLMQAIATLGVFATDEAAQTLTKNLTEAGRRGLKQYASNAASHDPLSPEVLRALSKNQPAPAPRKIAAAAGAPAPVAEVEELPSLEPDELPPIEPTS